MQVIMTMEEYQELLNRENKLNEYHQTQLLGIQNKFVLEVERLRLENKRLSQELERMK